MNTCTFPGCTGRFDPQLAAQPVQPDGSRFTGWRHDRTEPADVAAHDCDQHLRCQFIDDTDDVSLRRCRESAASLFVWVDPDQPDHGSLYCSGHAVELAAELRADGVQPDTEFRLIPIRHVTAAELAAALTAEPELDEHYLAFLEGQFAVQEGRAMDVRGCYLCHLDATGQPDNTPRAALSPLRGVSRTFTSGGPDPYAVAVMVPCGHHLI